jgi:hypothetical protein
MAGSPAQMWKSRNYSGERSTMLDAIEPIVVCGEWYFLTGQWVSGGCAENLHWLVKALKRVE